MGNRKPSQFLRHLKNLAPDVPDDFLRTIRASLFPPHVQAIHASQTEGSLDSASHLADRFCEVIPLPTTASISPLTLDNPAGLLERIEELSPGCFTAGITNTAARIPESATARTPETASAALTTALCSPTTSASTTGSSETKPENATHRASTSRGIPASRKTPPADVNGG